MYVKELYKKCNLTLLQAKFSKKYLNHFPFSILTLNLFKKIIQENSEAYTYKILFSLDLNISQKNNNFSEVEDFLAGILLIFLFKCKLESDL